MTDRLLAYLIDFLIFSPVIGLIATPLLRELRTIELVDIDAPEATVLWAMMIAGIAVLAILCEALCVYFFRATPGQRFLQLEVRNFPGNGRVDLGQAFTRAFVRWLVAPFVLPLLSVYTHPLRRALHDRASDTLVVTLRKNGDPGPVEMERSFFVSWSRMVLLFVLVCGLVSVMRVRDLLQDGHFTRVHLAEEDKLCRELPLTSPAIERLDRAVAGFLAGTTESDCVEREADLALWGRDSKTQAFAALAKGIVVEDKALAAEYLQQACFEDGESDVCSIARFASSDDEDRVTLLRRAGTARLTSQVLLLRESVDRGEVASAASLIRGLRDAHLFSSYVDREEVRALWGLRDSGKSRSPASSELNELRADFEKRYDLQ